MKYVLIALLALFLLRLLFYRKPKEGEPAAPPEHVQIPLETVDGRDCLVFEGVRYYAYAGEEVDGTAVWDWHGRMGDGIGVLTRSGGFMPVGELYRLRDGKGDILLAYLPEDGWPITDMQIFIREGCVLPEISPDRFSFGEVYRISGEFPEEELEKVWDLTEPSQVSELAEAWLNGDATDLPEAEYDRYRVRLHSSVEPGLYVTFLVNVCRERNCYAVEQYRFRGDSLLPATWAEIFRRCNED